MQYQLIELNDASSQASAWFIEGAVLAANLTIQPTDPDTWLTELLGDVSAELRAAVTEQIHKQHNRILRNEYSLLELVSDKRDNLADFAEGFMSLWPRVEEQWQSAIVNDGTQRMMQALFTSFMLAIDEEGTQQQMRAAGIEAPPALSDFIGQMDLMINEVALAADELMVGNKSQSLNPFKGVGRNDPCPCQSGKKFKQCCGQ
ncbi:SEC-C domain-containing protein [Vibrio sp. IRLE0018]|uniref:SEC-C metal-binding domain-containing protein n=1 Tax=Vibrio floridensis TaxID=2908007 RepID=UPI001F3C5BCE|nr:SEC-C metal-binding domain-containing protein [Vibrio floridensis]MCF8779025.1 SEC-C domain-containing protein [Vibrio floridensis]